MSEKESNSPDLLDLSALLSSPSPPTPEVSQEPPPPAVEANPHLHLLPADPAPAAEVAAEEAIQQIADFAVRTTIGHPPLTPRIPFSLRITGVLPPHHRARFLDLVKAADLGLRELDLEPQLESGQILLTRISEYVGIQIVQALRDAPVRMTLTPDSEDPDLLPPASA